MVITAQTPVWPLEITVEQLLFILYPVCLISASILWYYDLKRRRARAEHPEGYMRLGIKGESNLADEYDNRKYALGVDAQAEASGEPRWKVKALMIHPVKSCAPVELDASQVEASGLTWDRKFAFAELLAPTTRVGASEEARKPVWTFRTLRQPGYEKLALVKPEVWVPDLQGDTKTTSSKSAPSQTSLLILKYPNNPTGLLAPLDRFFISLGFLPSTNSFQVPLIRPENHSYPSEGVVIWGDTRHWFNLGRHVPDDLKSFLGVSNPLALFHADPSSYREVFRNAPRKSEIGYQPRIGFADAYPLHLLNLASVRDVANKVNSDIPRFSARRFRPNILVTGPAAYDEDDWKRVRIGGHEFYCACHTVRCRLPNVDPDSSERHPVEPDKTLKGFRCIDEGDPHNACLGLMLVPAKEEGAEIEVGMGVEVLERGKHVYIKR